MIRTITKWSKSGKKVRVKRAEWFEMLRRFKLTIAAKDARIAELEQELGGARARGGGGDCDSFCGTVCEDNGRCDFEFGEPPECGAACGDGSVKIQEEV